jgi:nitrous oxide reductase accessory protein NosL
LRLLVAVVFCALALAACGRQATEEDCRAIIDKNVEIQMKSMNITDPDSIEKKKKEMRAEFESELKGCVGKRVTDSMMECVKRAQKPDEIDKCMR